MFEDLIEPKKQIGIYIVKCWRCNQDMVITQEGYDSVDGDLNSVNWVCNKCLGIEEMDDAHIGTKI